MYIRKNVQRRLLFFCLLVFCMCLLLSICSFACSYVFYLYVCSFVCLFSCKFAPFFLSVLTSFCFIVCLFFCLFISLSVCSIFRLLFCPFVCFFFCPIFLASFFVNNRMWSGKERLVEFVCEKREPLTLNLPSTCHSLPLLIFLIILWICVLVFFMLENNHRHSNLNPGRQYFKFV